jgi:D-alanyl-D-alanine carboxypeptidase
MTAANGGLAADAPTVAYWGYQLYGGRVLPPELLQQMTAGEGEYGLGTMLFTLQFGIGTAFGHRGQMPDHSSIMVVVPDHKVAFSVLLANGNKNPDTVASELAAAIQPLLAG